MKNKTYSIQIRHFRTGLWTEVTTHFTCASIESVKAQFEADYGKPVQVIEL